MLKFLFSAAVLCSAAYSAPVQWVGNGHWYELSTIIDYWPAVQAEAISKGGYLATITSQGEQDFLFNLFGGTEHWIGLQEEDNIRFNFHWVTGESLVYTHWLPGNPDNATCYPDIKCEPYVYMTMDGNWNDIGDVFGPVTFTGIIESDVAPSSVPEPSTTALLILPALALLRLTKRSAPSRI